MELSQLRYFAAVAKMGNMSKAAESLFVSQPNLSTSISRLEEEVGVRLFERRKGRITLNQSGERFLNSVEYALAALDDGIRDVRNQHCGRPESLSIACMVDDTALLERFILDHPTVNLLHRRADLPSVTEMLHRQEVDLALTVLTPPGDEIEFERIYQCAFVLLMRQDHPLAAYPALKRAQLAGEHLAIDGSRVNRDTYCAAENKFGVSPVIDYDVRHLDLLLSLVESNHCVSIVPAIKYKELYLQGKHRSLVCREYADGSPNAYWGIAYHKRSPLTEQGLCFRNFVKSYFFEVDQAYDAAVRKDRDALCGT
ncbi:MAG: LysR family transcriptional regulator [Clostridia bacterium]|nr:LysR family transcriptional regulator [Clostridia bacterium]